MCNMTLRRHYAVTEHDENIQYVLNARCIARARLDLALSLLLIAENRKLGLRLYEGRSTLYYLFLL